MKYDVVFEGFATPQSVTGVPGSIAGCLYNADGRKVVLSERLGGHYGDLVRSKNPDQTTKPKKMPKLKGRGVYLGHFMGAHYGHFITETLSTFWVFDNFSAKDFDYFLFHPFVFGIKINDYARYCFDRFSIDINKILFVTESPVGFDEIIVPERLFRLNHSADSRLKKVYDKIIEETHIPRISESQTRVYLSRRRVTRKTFQRLVANENSVERIFKNAGFRIVYPETCAFAEQLSIYAGASLVAGFSGSALHNSVFMRQGTTCLEIGDGRYQGKPSPTQVLCDQISGVRGVFIPFDGRVVGPRGAMLFNVSVIEEKLSYIIGDGVRQSDARPPLWYLLVRVAEIGEVCFLLMRSTLGYIAREKLRLYR